MSAYYPIVHLAIDVQGEFIEELSGQRCESFAMGVAQFGADLRSYGVPTIHVAFGKYKQDTVLLPPLVPVMQNVPSLRPTDQVITQLDIRSGPLFDDEAILIKGRSNAFWDHVLSSYIRELGTKIVLLSGMNTSACVAETASGAGVHGLETWLIYDRLADIKFKKDADSAWHKKVLQDFVRTQSAPIRIYSAHDCLAQLRDVQREPALTRPISGFVSAPRSRERPALRC